MSRLKNEIRLNREFLGFPKGTQLDYFPDKHIIESNDGFYKLIIDGNTQIQIPKSLALKNMPETFISEEEYIRNEEKEKILELLKEPMSLYKTPEEVLGSLQNLFEKIRGEIKK